MVTRIFSPCCRATTLMPYFRRRFRSIRLCPTHSGRTSISMRDTLLDSSIISTKPEESRFFARRRPDSNSGMTTLSAPTLLRILPWVSLAHLAMMVGTPASLHSITARTLASRLEAMATMTTSMLPTPSRRMTSGSVMSAHLHSGISRAAELTTVSLLSTASTSAPSATNSLATAIP